MTETAHCISQDRRPALSSGDLEGFHRLLCWTSPAFPTGAFSYSQGLEWAVETNAVVGEAALCAFIAASLSRGGLWIDAVLFCEAWRTANDADALDDLCDVAAAWRASEEAVLESRQQGLAFLSTAKVVSPHPILSALVDRRRGRPVVYSVALAVACAVHDISLEAALNAYLHGAAANLVSAGIRLGVTGQTGGQRTIAQLAALIPGLAIKAMTVKIEEVGASAIELELFTIAHETQHTRLFRS